MTRATTRVLAGSQDGSFYGRLSEPDRMAIRMDFHRAQEVGTDEAFAAWARKYGQPLTDFIWRPA